MPAISHPEKEKRVGAFLDRVFPCPGRAILEVLYLDIRRPNIQDTKSDFQTELAFVKRSTDDLFQLYTGLMSEPDASIDTAAGIAFDFSLRARKRNKPDDVPKAALGLILQNARAVDYWRYSKLFVFDLYLSFSGRLKELKEQQVLFWSAMGRPPDHYARIMALRFAKLFAKERKRLPTIGTASEGDHPSTDYGRGLQELFEILEIETGFRLPGEWAVSQMTEDDLPKTYTNNLLNPDLMPNLLDWNTQKS